jgi:hypothetical protein
VTAHAPPPFDADDLRRAYRLVLPPEDADRVVDDSLRDGPLHSPGTIWVGDTLFWVALLSPAHAERMRAYLGLAQADMDRELARVRQEVAEIAAKLNRPR